MMAGSCELRSKLVHAVRDGVVERLDEGAKKSLELASAGSLSGPLALRPMIELNCAGHAIERAFEGRKAYRNVAELEAEQVSQDAFDKEAVECLEQLELETLCSRGRSFNRMILLAMVHNEPKSGILLVGGRRDGNITLDLEVNECDGLLGVLGHTGFSSRFVWASGIPTHPANLEGL